MAVRKVNHSRRIRSKKSITISSVGFGNIIEFNYSAKDVYDKTPMIFILSKKGKILNGINIGYLKESIIENLLEETNFKNLRHYSSYEKAFRTYKISNMKMVKLIEYETLPQRKQRQKMKISYSILTHNEDKSLQKLLEFLVKHKDEEDEIVILDDYSDNKKTIEILDVMTSMHEMTFEQRHLLKDYAGQKNYLTRMCKNDYIVNIDADEIPHKSLMKNLKPILQSNPTIDLYWVPRVNTVDGITQEHINKWGWNVNEKNWVNFPDYQGRIWRNRPNILWKNKVHEILTGYKEHTYLPAEEQYSFYHPKTIDRQVKQNLFYEGI